MHIRDAGAVPSGEWDAAVDQSDEAWLFHRTDWMAIERAFFAKAGHSFAVCDTDETVLALCPLYERQLGRHGWTERLIDSGHHRQTGLALVNGLSEERQRQTRTCGVRHILELAGRVDADRVLLNAHNLAPSIRSQAESGEGFWLTQFGFESGLHVGPNGDLALPGLNTPNLDQIVALDGEDETLFARLESSCRRAVRKAAASGVSVRLAEGDPVPVYYGLAERSARRTGERLQPQSYFRELWDRFAPGGRCAAHVAWVDHTAAAALFLLIDKGGASFLGGVSDPDFLPLRVNDMLHWEAIRWARNRGLLQYRLGPVFPTLPLDWPISRVSRFKGKFGGASVPIVQLSLFRKPEKYEIERQAAGLGPS